MGKTYLVALFCVIRCILYPGSKICVASATRQQANEVLLKITEDFMKLHEWGSANLCAEISYASVGANKAVITFHNGSWIKVVTASDSGRGARANILIIDEFRMIEKSIIDTVLKKFLVAEREPSYMRKKEYAHLPKERNKELYMSSCWYKHHWSYDKTKAYFANMLDDTKKYFICALPYQIAIKEGLLSREQVQDEMSEQDFDETTFQMEMGAFWIGDGEDSFFKHDDIVKRRNIKMAYPKLNIVLNSKGIVPKLVANERRILSVDIALMGSTNKKKNDATSIMINSALQTSKENYLSNFVLIDSYEGMTVDDLALIIMRYYYIYNCTDLVIDTQGQGLGVYDLLIKDQYDSETGEVYPALTCCNDDDMAARCKIKGAKKSIWSVKANEKFNTQICTLLRSGLQRGKINLLVDEYKAIEVLKENISGFNKMSDYLKSEYIYPYVQTRLAQSELTQLEYTVTGKNVRIKERSRMRKDRYSSMAYNYYVMTEIERELKPKTEEEEIQLLFSSPVYDD